jgi:hypothetical protein
LTEDFPNDPRLHALPKNLDGGGVMGAVNLAAHEPFNFFLVQQTQTKRRFNKWADVTGTASKRARKAGRSSGTGKAAARACRRPICSV